jgi:hypothetical protein
MTLDLPAIKARAEAGWPVPRASSVGPGWPVHTNTTQARIDALALVAEVERLTQRYTAYSAIANCEHDHFYFSGSECPTCVYERAAEKRAAAMITSLKAEVERLRKALLEGGA